MEEVRVYIIANLQIHDADRYREYEKGFFPILKKYEGEFITFDDNIVTWKVISQWKEELYC